MNVEELTPVERRGDYWFKRDDLFEVYGARGGKARAAFQLISQALAQGFKGIATAGARESPQCEIVSCICEALRVPCFLFMPRGRETSVLKTISQNTFSQVVVQRVGYNNVIAAHAREYARANGLFYVPFGMECAENVKTTMQQAQNVPQGVRRVVVPFGSGMSMACVLNGLTLFRRYDVRVLGVQVGRRSLKNLEKFYQPFLGCKVDFELVASPLDYHDAPAETSLCGVELDPIYEAKCVPFMQPGDLLWVVGHRR